MNNRFLITGGGGFVGLHFVEYLQQNEPTADICVSDVMEKLPCGFPQVNYIQLDLKEFAGTVHVLNNISPNYILHLASISSVAESWHKPQYCFYNNTNIFLNLMEAVRETGIEPRILSVGSSEEYGNYSIEEMPLRESHGLHPCNPYAIARVSQELLSQLYSHSYGLDIVMTRSFNHIGPRQRDIFVISSFVKQLCMAAMRSRKAIMEVGNIDIVRDFLDVRDVAYAYYLLLQKGANGEIYNVCSGNGVRLGDVIEKIASMLSVSVELKISQARLRPSDNMVIIGNNEKIKNELAWRPSYTLEQSLKDMICYYQDNHHDA